MFAGDDHEGSWVTSLVAIALRDLVPAIPPRLKGLRLAPAYRRQGIRLALEMEVPHG